MRVSVVIPNHNCVTWLPLAVESCLKQTHKDLEIVIVDDGSTDMTRQYLEWLVNEHGKKVKVICNGRNVGRSEARNIGNKAATGDIICVLDADDMSVTNRTDLTIKKINEGYDFVYGSAILITALGEVKKELTAKPLDIDKILKDKSNGIVHSSCAYTKETAIKFPYQGGEIARLGIDDWEQQIRLINAKVKLGVIPQIITAYRVLETAVTNTRDMTEVEKFKEDYLQKEMACVMN